MRLIVLIGRKIVARKPPPSQALILASNGGWSLGKLSAVAIRVFSTWLKLFPKKIRQWAMPLRSYCQFFQNIVWSPFKVKPTLDCMGLILAHIIGFNLTRGKFLTMSKNVGATSRPQIPFPYGLYGREQENTYRTILSLASPKNDKNSKKVYASKVL